MYERYQPLYYAVTRKLDLKWFKLIFDLSKKVDIAPTKDDFEKALKHDRFAENSKECQSIIKENYQKFYPKE